MRSSCTIWLLLLALYSGAQVSGNAEVYYYNEGKENGSGLFGRATFKTGNSWVGDLRYNYDDDKTWSLYAGRNFSDDIGPVEWEMVPAVGVTGGNLRGLALSASTSLSVDGFEFWSQVNAHRGWKSGYSFYTWTEGTYQPVSWLYAGGCVQNGQLPATGNYFEYGMLVGFVVGRFEIPVYTLRDSKGNLYFMSGCTISWSQQHRARKITKPVQF